MTTEKNRSLVYICLFCTVVHPVSEREADEEEERLRKERERQKERLQKQHVMTLGETREQIANLRSEVVNLEKEKRNLFTELKRILHEEEHRKRLVKENRLVYHVNCRV